MRNGMRLKEERSFIWLIQFLVAIIEKSGRVSCWGFWGKCHVKSWLNDRKKCDKKGFETQWLIIELKTKKFRLEKTLRLKTILVKSWNHKILYIFFIKRNWRHCKMFFRIKIFSEIENTRTYFLDRDEDKYLLQTRVIFLMHIHVCRKRKKNSYTCNGLWKIQHSLHETIPCWL